MAHALVADVPFVSGADAVFLNAIPEPLIHSPPARRFGVDAPAMLPAASNALAAGFAAGLYDGSALDQQQAAQAAAQQAMTRQHAHGQPMIVVSNGLAMPPLLPQQLGAHTHPQDGASAAAAARARRASAAAAMGMQALGMDGDSSDALASLQAYVIGEDPWESLPASAAAVGPSGPQPPMMQLQVPQHQASLAPLSPQMLPGGGAMPMLMPTAPRAPRARRHSMFVSAGADPRAVRRGSVGNFDSNPALMQQLQQAAAAASLPAGAVFAPIQSGRATPNGYGGTGTPSGGVNAAALQMGLASAAIAERLAVLGLGDPAAGQLPAGGLLQQAQLAQSQPSLAAQMQVPLAQRQQAPPWAAAAAPGAAPHGGAFVAGAPRAPNAGSSRRHSWCPTGSVYFGPDGVRAARPGRGDQLAPMQMVDGSVGGTSGYTNLAASTSSYATPSQSSLHYSQPPSPLSSNGSAAAAAKAAGGVAQYAPAGAGAALAPDALGAAGPGGQYVFVAPPPSGGVGGGGGLLQLAAAGDYFAPEALPYELLQAAEGLLIDPVTGMLVAPAAAERQQLYADRWDYPTQAALAAAAAQGAPGFFHGAPRPGNGNGRAPPRAAPCAPRPTNGAGAGAGAAAQVQVQLLPVPSPASKVCGDAKWELRRRPSDPADPLAGLEGLAAWLESRRTLEGERLREERRQRRMQALAAAPAAAAASAAAPAAPAGVADADAAFPYALPDAGDDTWGGAGAGAAAEARRSASGACNISSEPSNKLFVGNIGWWVSEEDLHAWFNRFGTITGVKIMYNSRKMHKPKDKWRSREYGFVDFATPAEAARAIVWMDGAEIPELMKDRAGIIVQYAKPAND